MSKFHDVAISLRASANSNKIKNEELASAYGRSAFNRYYYACYLSSRDLVKKILPGTAFQHGEAPKLIEENVVKLIKKNAQQLKKNGLLSESEYSRITTTASQSAAEMARILKIGYITRSIADYEPEVLVIFDNDTFSIKDHSESEAKSWLGAVELHKGKLLKIAKELGIVN